MQTSPQLGNAVFDVPRSPFMYCRQRYETVFQQGLKAGRDAHERQCVGPGGDQQASEVRSPAETSRARERSSA